MDSSMNITVAAFMFSCKLLGNAHFIVIMKVINRRKYFDT